ncbi:hypothetical protein D3C73_919070 [compost metagenome]
MEKCYSILEMMLDQAPIRKSLVAPEVQEVAGAAVDVVGVADAAVVVVEEMVVVAEQEALAVVVPVAVEVCS